MPDQAQLIAQIRFAMEQLSERNGQHEWEHLCRHLARERICSNILPATGPVQAGGDQGRDFETFRTFLTRSTLRDRSFVGLVSEKPLAFACTLEKRIGPKVRRDVTTIMSSGTLMEGIYIFCTRDVPVAKRHELQEWAWTTHSVTLEILDGAAIAELLCDRDLFWLAERYLQLPTELLPVSLSQEEMDWYAYTLDKWRRETRPAQTYADFVEIRAAARTALGEFAYDDEGQPLYRHERPELPFWIDRLDEIANQGTTNSLCRRARYEASVFRLRGLGSLIGQEEELRLYFGRITELENVADLADAEVLLTYLLPATRMRLVGLESSEVAVWFDMLEHHLDERLREAKKYDKVNERCALLQVRGHVALFRRFNEAVIDVTEAFKYWKKLASLVARAPLFPLERFADHLADFARYIGTHPDYETLAQEVDALLAERFGNFKAAEKCLARAKAFQAAGDLPRAMAQLHRAKIDWFADETLGKSLLALEWLSLAYHEQGLFFAAKYYALTAAYITHHSDDLDLKSAIAYNLERAASCDYVLGAWHGFLELAEASAIFYPHFANDLDTDLEDPNRVLYALIFHLGLIPVATKLLQPDLEYFARAQCSRIADQLGLKDVLDDVQVKAEKIWAKKGQQELWDTIQEQLAAPPWIDAGPVRYTHWKAHGVTWRVEWQNDYATLLAAETFLSALQIFLSDLAGYDLCLMRTTLNISLQLGTREKSSFISNGTDYKGFDVYFEPSNAERRAIVTLPPHDQIRYGTLSYDDIQVGALGVANSLLAEVSLLPDDRFYQILKDRFAQGLPNKLLFGAPYARCLREFISQEDFNESNRTEHTPLELVTPFVSRLPEILPWFDGFGPGYDPKEAARHIQNRYERFSRPLGRTLKRLAQEPEFQLTLTRLRADNWKDWHILTAVFHVTMNYRNNQSRELRSHEAAIEATQRLMQQTEPENALPVPIEEYTEAKLRQQIPIFLPAFIKTYGLEIHQHTPDGPALEDFVHHRYNFWIDDVDHDDPFKG